MVFVGVALAGGGGNSQVSYELEESAAGAGVFGINARGAGAFEVEGIGACVDIDF